MSRATERNDETFAISPSPFEGSWQSFFLCPFLLLIYIATKEPTARSVVREKPRQNPCSRAHQGVFPSHEDFIRLVDYVVLVKHVAESWGFIQLVVHQVPRCTGRSP